MRNLIIILGDQLNSDSRVLRDIDVEQDCIWMAEVSEESSHVWSHKARILVFLSAMRNFCKSLRQRGLWVVYHKLGEHQYESLQQALAHDIHRFKPERIRLIQPGEYRVLAMVTETARQHGTAIDVVDDGHFIIDGTSFNRWSEQVSTLRMESFYRHVRKQTGILMDGEKPIGGQWNFDHDNRKSFSRQGPGLLMSPEPVRANSTTRKLSQEIDTLFPSHPGSMQNMIWPVTRTQALEQLKDFIDNRLYAFGRYQDAMWTGHPFLYHSRLSVALNLKLLSPEEVTNAVLEAWNKQQIPIQSVEGFLRQVIGWREYMHGIYWKFMPAYAEANALSADLPLPDFYWNADTDMTCLHETIRQVLDYGYAHHIQRLMVTGLFALLLGVRPQHVHEWYLAMFVDAVEWVEMPNTLGMSQYADDGLLASKPYIASGKYIQRMSNYCSQCRYNPANMTGKDACPFTTLYWDFLLRHQTKFRSHPRVALQWRNLDRLGTQERKQIRRSADRIRSTCVDADTQNRSKA